MTEPTVTQADSGFSPENLADAEWLWTNLPVGHLKFHERPTYEKALICHTVARFREASTAELRARVEVLEQLLLKIDRCVSHAIMGDWRIAFDDIRRNVRAALGGNDA